MEAKERVSLIALKAQRTHKGSLSKALKLRNLVKKPLKKKVLMKTSSPISQGRSTSCGNIKEDLDERTTRESTPRKSKQKSKWCTTSAKSLDISSLNALVWKRRRRKKVFLQKGVMATWEDLELYS
ncbi:hypothetical protein CR513_38543, partial [Mucuna pruriens]